MTTDKRKRGEIRDETAPLAADGPVIENWPVTPSAAGAEPLKSQPPADSSLIGQGGLPAAAPRGDGETGEGDAAGYKTAGEPPLVLERPVASEPDPSYAARSSAGTTPAPRRGGFWPLVLGGAVAAGLGAGAAWTLKPQLTAVPAEAPAGLTAEGTEIARGAGAEAARAEITAQAEALAGAARQAGGEAGTAAAEKLLADAPAGAAPEAAVLTAQADRIAALEAKIAQLPSAAPVAAPQGASTAALDGAPVQPDALAALRADLAAQAQRIEELASRPALDPAAAEELRQLAADAGQTRQAINETATAVDARLKEAEGKVDSLGASVADTARRAEHAAAAMALQSALTSGSAAPPPAEQLRAAGIATPEALDQPIPALSDLQRDFPDAARAGLKAALRAAGGAGDTSSGLVRFLRAQTGARSVTPREGTDPDAILSRAGAAVTAGDIAAALTEIETLPPDGQTAMADWTARAKVWAAARTALGSLETKP